MKGTEMEALQQLISSGEALYIIVSNPTGTRWEEYGDKERLPYKGKELTAYEFSGPENMPVLDKFLEGQILPQTFRQGEASCIICKPREDVIIGVFTVISGVASAERAQRARRALTASDRFCRTSKETSQPRQPSVILLP